MNIKTIRRQNLRALARTLGGITALAKRLDKRQSQLSHVIGVNPCKNIGDKLAADIERIFAKPNGWLDQLYTDNSEDSLYCPAYAVSPSYRYAPLLAWNEVAAWIAAQPHALPSVRSEVAVSGKLSAYTFALTVENDSMAAPSGISFLRGAQLIVDPEAILKNGCYVIIAPAKTTTPIFRQWMRDGAARYLKPLNPDYPITVLEEPYVIYGVVREAIFPLGF
jgi:SOS-response transcriptional repressor LexA